MYDAQGRRTTLQLGGGVVCQYAFDNGGRLTTQIDFAGATPISTFIDSYDPVGNRVGRVQDGGIIFTWSYDNNYRLTGQQSAGAYATLAYDSMSKTLLKWYQGSAPQTMIYDGANRLDTSTIGNVVTTFTFSNVFRSVELTGNSATSFSYDGENRQTLIQYPNGTLSTYTFQGWNGLRRSAYEPGVALNTFVWDGSDYLQERQ